MFVLDCLVADGCVLLEHLGNRVPEPSWHFEVDDAEIEGQKAEELSQCQEHRQSPLVGERFIDFFIAVDAPNPWVELVIVPRFALLLVFQDPVLVLMSQSFHEVVEHEEREVHCHPGHFRIDVVLDRGLRETLFTKTLRFGCKVLRHLIDVKFFD